MSQKSRSDSAASTSAAIPCDTWAWGRELLIWGYQPQHHYTFKIIEPRQGRAGCMSLQYHDEKSETWLVLRGEIWALFVVESHVCTRIMRPGDIQNISPTVVHRMCGITNDAQVAEPSTPDVHAADKSRKKDVVRLHCVHGRETAPPRDAAQGKLIGTCVEYTDEAIRCVEQGTLPPEYNLEILRRHGAFSLGWKAGS